MIKEIRIEKFRKLENVNETKFGLVNELYGSNGSGKTSFISFITWMLYGETLDYGKNDDMNIDSFNPNELIGGEIECEDCILKRVYGYENGKKVNDFFVNGRKTKNQTEYYNAVETCFNVDLKEIKIKEFNMLRALSDPYYLPNNETQFRTLIETLLNVNTYDVLFEKEKYSQIKKDFDLQGKDYQNTKAFYKQKIKETESALDVTNSRISELKSIKFDQKEYDDKANELNELRKSFSTGNDDELNSAIEKLNETYDKLITSRKNDLVEKPKSENEIALDKLKKEYNEYVSEYEEKVRTNNSNIEMRKIVNEKIVVLANELKSIKESNFKEVRCPECNALVNEEDYKVFNENKVKEIKKIKERIDVSKKELETYVDFDITEITNKIVSDKKEIERLKALIFDSPNIYSSELTKSLENEYNTLNESVKSMREDSAKRKEAILKEYNEKVAKLEEKLNLLNNDYVKSKDMNVYKSNKQTLLYNKSVYELRLSLLEEYRVDEINLIKSKTKEIFGNDFEFEMLVKNKINDNYKKVCYASIDGLEHNKSNTAKYLKYSIILLEKLKKFIGGCDLPIVFDIADNIGKTARKDIFEVIKSSQIFYTRICDDDDVERTLNIVKELN